MEARVEAGGNDLGTHRAWGPQRAEAVEVTSGAVMYPGPGINGHFLPGLEEKAEMGPWRGHCAMEMEPASLSLNT